MCLWRLGFHAAFVASKNQSMLCGRRVAQSLEHYLDFVAAIAESEVQRRKCVVLRMDIFAAIAAL